MGRDGKVWVVTGLVGVAVAVLVGASGCDPADGLGASAVSVTTDQLATHALKNDKVTVQWLSCSASSGDKKAQVDCVGRTDDQQKISVKGSVTEQQDGRCIRGRLTAVVGKKTIFDVQGLGDCVHRAASST
jgi:hypothetical protein